MIRITVGHLTVFLRVYVVAALVMAAVLSPPALAFVPVVLLLWCFYLWRWRASATVSLLTECFVLLAMAVLLDAHVGPFSAALISLPLLFPVDRALRTAGEGVPFRDGASRRRPTDTALVLVGIVVSMLTVSLLLGSLSLLLACAVILAYLAVLYAIILRQLSPKPVEETQIHQRMVAGSEDHLNIELTSRTRVGGRLIITSPCDWLKVRPGEQSLAEPKLELRVSLAPPLAGPSDVELVGYAADRWGLLQIRFELRPIRLFVIPRARYAAWLAEKYLAATKPGPLALMADVATLRPTYGLRRGVEYYGSQQYQPGDSLKNIDWKHSLKYHGLIVKEFAEFHGQSAVVLVNLAVANAEEADELAYKIIVTALSLARESIPAALATYDDGGTRLTTTTLAPRMLLLQALQVAREMVTIDDPLKYLNPPDVTRLRANISRMEPVGSEASEALLRLLRLEYRNLDSAARLSPAAKALSKVFTRVSREATVVVISHRNHDAGAMAFLTSDLTRRGVAVVPV